MGARAAVAVLGGLIAFVLAANVLWPGPPPPDPVPRRWSPDTSPFPAFRMGPSLHVVSLDPASNLSTRLAWVSLQGLVNRVQVELFVDFRGDPANLSATLADWRERYAVAVDTLSPEAALDEYARRWNGTIVYDPSRPESVNIGTILASQRGGLLVGPDLAGWMRTTYGLPVLFDYARSDWASLDRIGAYDRALRELYPSANSSLLGILPPDRWAIRDYLIATSAFVFYLPQGVLASPFDVAATERILRAAPRGIPVLGWFDSPTLTEENAFVQAVSHEGKYLVGAQDVPNLSVMTALGRTVPRRQVPPPAAGPLEDKTYVVLAIPDGDNLDFMATRMRELWSERVDGAPVRGTVPIAWSVSPVLVDLAPPLLDAYYQGATPTDRLIAAPSGAGYLYPDFTGPDDLPAFVNVSARYMARAGLDVVWLLNAFPATEIAYSDASLRTYVDGLRPRGIVLDYADQPRSRDAWVVGDGIIAPVIRSTHFWTTADNVFGKVGAVAGAWDRGPHFIWLTVYPYRFGLKDALDLIGVLRARLPGGVEVVPPETFFSFLQRDFVLQEMESLRSMETDPLASLVFRGGMDAARQHLLEADVALGAGDVDRAAASAYLGLESLREVRAGEALLLSALVFLGAGVLAAQAMRTGRTTSRRAEIVRLEPLIFLVATIALFLLAVREAVEQNFWTYPGIVIGLLFSGFHRPLRKILDRGWGVRAPAMAALVDLIFVSLAIRTTAAFPLALLGTLLALNTYIARRPTTGPEVLLGLAFGTAIGFVGGFDLVTLTVLSLLLVLPAVRLRIAAPVESLHAPSRSILQGLLLTLPLGALAIAFSYSLAARFEVQGDRLVSLAAGFLVVPPALAVLLRRMARPMPSHTEILVGLALAGIFAVAVLSVVGTIPTALLLLGLFTSLSIAALAALSAEPPGGIDTATALSASAVLLPPVLLFLRMPPIVYSLTVVRLPEAVEYALYAPTSLLAAACVALFAVVALRDRVMSLVEKHYPRGRVGRPGGR